MLSTYFEYNHKALNHNLQDVSHKESLIAPPNGGNTINWVFGHIVVTRDEVLKLLDHSPLTCEALNAIYSRGNAMTNPEQAYTIEYLLDLYNRSQESILKNLPEDRKQNQEAVIKDLARLAFHEAYHVGQMGILRKVIGKAGAIG